MHEGKNDALRGAVSRRRRAAGFSIARARSRIASCALCCVPVGWGAGSAKIRSKSPNSGRIWLYSGKGQFRTISAISDPRWATVGLTLCKFGAVWAEFGAIIAKLGPASFSLCRYRPRWFSTKPGWRDLDGHSTPGSFLGQSWAGFENIWPDHFFSWVRPNSTWVRPKLGWTRPTMRGLDRPGLGRVRASRRRVWPNLGAFRPILGRVRPGFGYS